MTETAMSYKRYDLVVLGGSLNGCQTAIRAAKNGLSVAVVEEYRIGGLKRMAAEMPLETLLKNDYLLRECRKAQEVGLSFDGASFDPDAYYDSIRKKAEDYSKALVDALKKSEVDIYLGTCDVDEKRIKIDRPDTNSRYLLYTNIVLAREPKTDVPDIFGKDLYGFYTAENMGLLHEPPIRLMIYGYGSVSAQIALFWAYLGSKVDLVCPKDKLFPDLSKDAQQRFIDLLTDSGVTVYIDYKATDAYQDSKGIFHIDISNEESSRSLRAYDLILTTDQKADTEGLDKLHLTMEGNWVKVDNYLRTSDDHVYTWTESQYFPDHPSLSRSASFYLADRLAKKTGQAFNVVGTPTVVPFGPGYAKVGSSEGSTVYRYEEPETQLEIYLNPEFKNFTGAEAFGKDSKAVVETVYLLMQLEALSEDIERIEFDQDDPSRLIKEALRGK